MKRSSPVVRLGRWYQNISPAFGFVDQLFQPFAASDNQKFDTPVIILLAPPRSGSTLTYQLMTTGIKGFYVSNLWNVLAATPYLGGVLSKSISKDHVSDLVNQQGMVQGLSGEAEGMFFFTQNIGQNLREQERDDEAKYQKFAKVIQKLGGPADGAFIAGYMGHVFSVRALRKVFKRTIFVHLSRDLVSNAVSLEKIAPKEWVSSRPKSLFDLTGLSRKEQITKQLVAIHRQILQGQGEDFVSINYREICENPQTAMGRIIEKAQQLYGVDLKDKNFQLLPEQLKYSFVSSDANESSSYYRHAFEQELAQLNTRELAFFKGLLIH